MKLNLLLALATAALFPLSSHAASLSDLEARIEALETELEIVNDAVTDSASSFEYATKVSGYIDVEFRDTASASPGFRLHHANFIFIKKFNDKWDFFSELELENGPKFEAEEGDEIEADGGIFLEKVGFNYHLNANMSVRMGRFSTPAGIWNEAHYTPFALTQVLPMHIRKIFPSVTDGAGIYGTLALGSTFMNYNLYTGNGKGNGGGGDGNKDKAIGLKASFILPRLQHLETGFSYYSDTLNDGTDLKGQGVHLLLREGDFILQAEYASGEKSGKDLSGFYFQPVYNLGMWSLGLRYDVWDGDASADTIKKRTKATTNSLFVNYHVTANIVMKAEYHTTSYDDSAIEDEATTVLTVAVFLGQ